MKRKYKLITAAAIACLSCLFGVYWMLKPGDEQIYSVVLEDMTEELTSTGYVTPRNVQVITSALAGTVVSVPIEGQDITAGSSRITVDDSAARKQIRDQMDSLKLQLAAAESEEMMKREELELQLAANKLKYEQLFLSGNAIAAKETAKAAYQQAERNYQNGQILRQEGYLSDQDLQNLHLALLKARQDFSAADAESSDSTRAYYEGLIKSCQSQLTLLKEGRDGEFAAGEAMTAQLQITMEALEDKLSDASYILLAEDSLISQVFVSPGQYVTENQPLFSFYAKDDIYIKTQLLAEDSPGITEGMEVILELPDKTVRTGTVDFISSVATETISSIGLSENKCTAAISAAGLPDTAGSGFPVDITFKKIIAQNTVSVPLSAVVPSGEENAVYLLTGRKKQLIPVTLGVKGGGRVQILTGIKEGDCVVTNPLE